MPANEGDTGNAHKMAMTAATVSSFAEKPWLKIMDFSLSQNGSERRYGNPATPARLITGGGAINLTATF